LQKKKIGNFFLKIMWCKVSGFNHVAHSIRIRVDVLKKIEFFYLNSRKFLSNIIVFELQ